MSWSTSHAICQPDKARPSSFAAPLHCVTAIAGLFSHPRHLRVRRKGTAMFSTKVTRVAHRATCATANNSSATAHRSTSCLATRRSHQRRHSSSKTSCPPASSASGGKPAPAAKATGEKSPLADPTTQQRGQKRVGNKTSKKARTGTAAAKPEDQFAGLPAVPGTQHIDERGEFNIRESPYL